MVILQKEMDYNLNKIEGEQQSPPLSGTGGDSPLGLPLPPSHFVVFDLETRHLADEVGGWKQLMSGAGGITSLVIFDSISREYSLYDDHTLEQAALHLESADVVIGWNSIKFDVPTVEGHLGRKLHLKHHWDLKLALCNEVGQFTKGTGLSDTCLRTFGLSKNGSALDAPSLSRQGRFAELFSYCINDVRLTLGATLHTIHFGFLIGPDGLRVRLKVPAQLKVNATPIS